VPLGGGDTAGGSPRLAAAQADAPEPVTAAELEGAGEGQALELEHKSRPSRRIEAATLLFLLLSELVVVGYFVWFGAKNVADDPPVHAFPQYIPNAGQQAIAHLDLLRAVGFLATAALATGVLVLAMTAVRRLLKADPAPMRSAGRLCLAAIAMVNLVGCVIAAKLFVDTQHFYRASRLFSSEPTIGYVTGISALVLLTVCVLCVVWLVKRGSAKTLRLLPAALGVAAVICVAQIGVEWSPSSNTLGSPSGPGLPAFDGPLRAGFWSVNYVQHPASAIAYAASCGSPTTCAIFGSGFSDNNHQELPELTVSNDGGTSWKSWVFGSSAPFEVGVDTSVCSGSVCEGPASIRDGFGYMDINADGEPSAVISRNRSTNLLGIGTLSCPSPGWCGGIFTGSNSTPSGIAAFLTVTDKGAMWKETAIPPTLVPPGEFLSLGSTGLDCGAIGHCVLSGTRLVLPGESPSPAARRLVGTAVIAITSDGGKSWSKARIPGSATSIYRLVCPDSTHCTALAGSAPPSANGANPPTEMISSEDGGLSWSKMTTNLNFGHLGLKGFFCGDSQHCILLSANEGQLYTQNAGRTWKSSSYENVPIGFQMVVFSGACATGQFCVLTGGAIPSGLGVATPILLVTHNGGASWSVQRLPVPRLVP
jgi:hypothetical protein